MANMAYKEVVALSIKQVWDWWLSTARHPVFATFANLLGVFAGLLGALYTDDIRSAFPFYSGPYTGVSIHSIVFWTGFSVFALTFLSREYSADKQRVASQEQLEDTIRTMPPRDFVVEFAQYYAQSHKAVRALNPPLAATEDEIRAAIRMVLSCIAQLARRFDAAQQFTYSANIKLYWPSVGEWQRYAGNDAKPNVKFAELEAAIDRIPLLILDTSLSATTSNSQPGDPDPALVLAADMALPVPGEGRNGRSEDARRWRVLPGGSANIFYADSKFLRERRRTRKMV